MVQACLLPKPKVTEEESQEKLLGQNGGTRETSNFNPVNKQLTLNKSNSVIPEEDEDATVNAHHLFAHPNLQSVNETSMAETDEEEEEPPSCMNYFHYIDDRYLRPCFVHKYKKLKKMNQEVNFDDVLEGYKIM